MPLRNSSSGTPTSFATGSHHAAWRFWDCPLDLASILKTSTYSCFLSDRIIGRHRSAWLRTLVSSPNRSSSSGLPSLGWWVLCSRVAAEASWDCPTTPAALSSSSPFKTLTGERPILPHERESYNATTVGYLHHCLGARPIRKNISRPPNYLLIWLLFIN